MNRDNYLDDCARYFARLAHEVRALNAMGRFDINGTTEDLLIPVLKEVFDCPELRNQNELRLNFPSVDLGCERSRISFQVTTDASSDKVAKTLEKFREHQLERNFDHVYVVTVTEKQSSYNARALERAVSRLSIAFEPSADILDLTDLLSRMRYLDTDRLERIDSYLATEFTKRDELLQFREELDRFLEFAQSKIEVEKRSKKYIPSIFVETHATKESMRVFAHPLFFYRKAQDVLGRIDYAPLNSLLKIAKEPQIASELDNEALMAAPASFADLQIWSKRLTEAIETELTKLTPLSWGRDEEQEEYEPAPGNLARWQVVKFQAESTATGLTHRLRDALDLIDLMHKKIFLVTSMAGQGKTNFVCDLVENQFRSFGIPSIFVPARELNGYAARQRLLGFIANNRYAPSLSNVHNVHAYLRLFNDVARENGKPFLLVVDGINEVSALEEFNAELRDFCNALCQYDYVKMVITCRSEFFDEKFATLLDEPLSAYLHRVTDLRGQMSDATKDRLLNSYLSHFKIQGNVDGPAEEFLKNDLLLLRIFCERNEGLDVGYVRDIYKGDLFEEFLLRKIESFPGKQQRAAFPTLLKIASAMLANGDYSKLSVREFSLDEQEVIARLVGDDVVLRQEVSERDLTNLGDLVISFTYDELRDFVLAYMLVDSTTLGNAERLKVTLSQLPGRPIFEGVYKYVYLLARKRGNRAAIETCEDVEDFLDHFALNVHLLPPSAQDADDVARLRLILADNTRTARVRRTAWFLVGRQNLTEKLNASLLVEHLNSLDTEDHRAFIRTMFFEPNDFRSGDWREHIDELMSDLWERNSQQGLSHYAPERLAFFLHSLSLANWEERERVSTLFSRSIGEANCQRALLLIRAASSKHLQDLLSEIEQQGTEAHV